MDHETREFIETIAENVARKMAEEMRKDLSRAFERIGIIESRVGLSTGNGLIKAVDSINDRFEARQSVCNVKFDELKRLASGGLGWRRYAMGAVAGFGACGTLVLGAVELMRNFK